MVRARVSAEPQLRQEALGRNEILLPGMLASLAAGTSGPAQEDLRKVRAGVLAQSELFDAAVGCSAVLQPGLCWEMAVRARSSTVFARVVSALRWLGGPDGQGFLQAVLSAPVVLRQPRRCACHGAGMA